METKSTKSKEAPTKKQRRRGVNWRLLPSVHAPRRELDSDDICTHTSPVRYSFDPAKRASNLKKHGLDLAEAAKVIESGQTVTFEDRRFDYGEERFVTLGLLYGVLVAVVTAETEDQIRVISMRKANRHEQGIYRENLG